MRLNLKILEDTVVTTEIGDVKTIKRLDKKLDNQEIEPILLTTTSFNKKKEVLRNRKNCKQRPI